MKNLDELIAELESSGRHGDTMLAHINPQEAELLKALGGSGTINPKTGLPEFWSFSVGPVSVGSDVGGISVGGVSTGDIVDKGLNLTKELLKPAVKVGKWAWENPVEAASLAAAGYYFAPEIGAWIDSAGSAVAGTEAGTAAGATTLTAEEVAAQQAIAAEAAKEAATQAALTAEVSPYADQLAIATGNADKAALLGNAGYGEAMTAGEKAAFDSGFATAGGNAVGATAGSVLGNIKDSAQLAALIAGLTAGRQQSGTSSTTGFPIIPVPTDWKPPEYTNTPVKNVSFEDLFPGVSLQGMQWAGLQNQQPNMTFNDIFASGQQQTPMGMPVNIQDIVGSILGQSAKS